MAEKDRSIVTVETLRVFPRRVPWSDVVELNRFDERFGALNVVEGAIMDVGDDHVALTTDDEEPMQSQLVAWVWLVRPDLGSCLREIASQPLREAIDYYEEKE